MNNSYVWFLTKISTKIKICILLQLLKTEIDILKAFINDKNLTNCKVFVTTLVSKP